MHYDIASSVLGSNYVPTVMNSQVPPTQYSATYARFVSADQVHFSLQSSASGIQTDYPTNVPFQHSSFTWLILLFLLVAIGAAGIQVAIFKSWKLG